MSGYEDRIRARKRNEFEQKRQVNQRYAEQIAAGATPAEAATAPRVYPMPRNKPYTWTDGDTLDSVAQQFNLTPQQLLQYNPLMKTPATGMVLETNPPPQFPNYYRNPNAAATTAPVYRPRTTATPVYSPWWGLGLIGFHNQGPSAIETPTSKFWRELLGG
jgi:LysM repeat protein